MINKIETKHYHSHKNTVIEFCDGVNVITGASDAGKSDILRQIKWVVDNRPTGNSVRSWLANKEDAVSVCITTTEGSCLKSRQLDKSSYQLISKSGMADFEIFKTDVPDEVQAFFNFSNLNYQSQHQQYLMLADSPGEVAKKLNDLVGLSIIDIIFKNLNSRAIENKHKSEEEAKKSMLLGKEIKNLAYLDIAERELNSISNFIDAYENKIIKNKSLLLLIQKHKEHRDKIFLYEKWIAIEKEVKNLLNDIIIYQKGKEKLSKIKRIVLTLKDCQNNIAIEKEWLKIEKDYRDLKKLLDKYVTKKDDLTKLIKIIVGCKFVSDFREIKNKLSDLIARKVKLLKENKICPLCKTQLSDEVIERIVK